MFRLCRLSSFISKWIEIPDKKSGFIFVRSIHNSFIYNVKLAVKVNEYLLNRRIPATEILQSLEPEDAETLNKIKTMHQFLLSNGELVPKSLSDKDYLELLCLSSMQRKKHLVYLAKLEFKRLADRNGVEQRKANKQTLEESEYVIGRVYSKYVNNTIKELERHKLFTAITLKAQEIVFDFSYEESMYRREVSQLANQMQLCYSLNKSLEDPFHMVFTNLKPDSITRVDLENIFLTSSHFGTSDFSKLEDFPILVSDKHSRDLFPDRRLVYLSPNSTHFFEEGEYDHDAIYIVGGIVDKSGHRPMTLAQARLENTEHRAFPIDRAVKWKTGDKCLTLDQTLKLMSIARSTNGDWTTAIRKSVPQRNLVENLPRQNYKDKFYFNQ